MTFDYDLKASVRTIPDYPKPGILFRDITTLLGDARAFRRAVDELVHPWAGNKIDKVAGIEARGFILGGVTELCTREKCSVRQANMTISLAFLAPNLVKAAAEGRLPRGIGVERLRDPPTEWSRQFQALGLNPE